VNSNIEVPKPRAIDRSKLVFSGNTKATSVVQVPLPANIDRSKLVYQGSGINIPTPAKIDRSKLAYRSTASKIVVPNPAKIDRSKLTYQGAKVTVPTPAKIDRSKLVYSEEPEGRDIPMPAVIDRSMLVYKSGPGAIPTPRKIDRNALVYIVKIIPPSPAVIDRDQLVFSVAPGVIPTPRRINRSRLVYEEPKLTALQQNVHSPVTPGAQNFPCFQVTPELDAEADRRIAQYPAEEIRSAVLPLLHEVQHKFGFISPESIDWVAGKLGIEPIKVVEVVTFYPGFRQKAPGKFHVRVCRTLSCAMGGSYELMDKLCDITGIDRSKEDGHKDTISVSPCGNFSVEYAECLASCGTAPVCLVNDDFHEGVTAEKAAELLDSYQNA